MTVFAEIPDGAYPMRAVTRMTGLTADTVRAWERRYRAVKPERTDGNARRYSASEVQRLVLLREATSRGHSISEIAVLSAADLLQMLQGEAGAETGNRRVYQQVIDSYLEAVHRYEARKAIDILARTTALLPPVDSVFRVIVPLLHQVGEQWCSDRLSIAHEHLISNQLKGLLSTMLRHTSAPLGAPRIVVATPPGHFHEFGCLVGAFVAASRGIEAIYLGVDVPFADLGGVMRETKAALLMLSVLRDVPPSEWEATVSGLQSLSTQYTTWIGAPEGHRLVNEVPAARFLHRFEELDLAFGEDKFVLRSKPSVFAS